MKKYSVCYLKRFIDRRNWNKIDWSKVDYSEGDDGLRLFLVTVTGYCWDNQGQHLNSFDSLEELKGSIICDCKECCDCYGFHYGIRS